MNILLINHYAGSPYHGMEYRPYYFALEWTKAGHSVTIVAASFSHVRFFQPKCLEPITIEAIDGIQYVWLKTPGYHGNGLKRVTNMFSFAGQLLTMSLPIEKPDVVLDSSTYPLTIFGANKIARKYGAKLIFEVHDLWPLSPMELGGFSKWHPFIMVIQWAENYAYKNAHRVVSLLPEAKGHMIYHGMSPEKFVYIPNGIDVSGWQLSNSLPEEHAKLLEKLKRNSKFIVGYAGAHGIANALQYFVKAAEMEKEEDKIHFLLVGQGPEKEPLQSLAKNKNLKNISFLPSVPKTSIPTLLAAMDALYIGLKHQPLFRFGVSPNKLMDYMMAAKPVIHAIDAGNDLVAESGCGISVAPEDPKAIADAVIHLFKMSQEKRDVIGQKGHDYVKIYHDYAVLAKKFLEVYE
ncbi:glycosyltransferase family 4 protein [candidate division WOR-3 bacterium]|nr:glycosyltransferase family 4 protein [candidate division WOR-3 bacterium]